VSRKTVDPAEVARMNLAGRMHPSQRWKVLGGLFWLSVLVFCFAAAELTQIDYAAGGTGYAVLAGLFMVAALAYCAWRLLVLLKGAVVTFTGFTHDIGYGPKPPTPYPILLHATKSQGGHPLHRMTYDGRNIQIDSRWHAMFRPEHVNTIVLTPNGRTVINVIPS
jgi:hypothetical protein